VAIALVFLGIFYPLLGLEITPEAALAAAIGALLPDIDARNSAMGLLLFPLTKALRARGLRHGTYTHSLLALPIVFSLFVLLPTSVQPQGFSTYLAVALGYVSHFFGDAMTKRGVSLLYPIRPNESFVYPWNPRWRVKAHSRGEFWIFLPAALLGLILVPVGHPGLVEMMKEKVTSPSNAVEVYYSLKGEYVAYAKIKGVWRDTQMPLEVTAPVVGAMGHDELLVYLGGDVYRVGRRSGAGIYSLGVKVLRDRQGGATSKTAYFEHVPLEFLLSEIKRGTDGGIVIITGEIKTQREKEKELSRVLLRLNRRTEAHPTVSLKDDTMTLFFTPVEKLEHFIGRGVYVYSARLTIREIPVAR